MSNSFNDIIKKRIIESFEDSMLNSGTLIPVFDDHYFRQRLRDNKIDQILGTESHD